MPRETWLYHDGDETKPKEWFRTNENGNSVFDPETGYHLPAVRQWKRDGTLIVTQWIMHGRGHNADRDRETGTPLPSVIGINGERRWSVCTMKNTATSPDDPVFQEHLAAWEREHGVHGSPAVKSAYKE